MKKKLSIILCLLLAISTLSFAGCGEAASSDEAFMNSLAKGLEARWKLTNAAEKTDEASTKKDWEGYLDAEYNQIKDYKDANFENADLGKWAKKYIKSIEASYDCLDYFDTDQWYEKYDNDVYQDRVNALYKINSIKAVPVSEDYKDNLTELLVNGEVSVFASKVMNKVKFEKVEEDYGWKTYQAVVENTSSTNFSYFSLTIALIDKDGVTVDTEEPSVDSWSAGEKVRFEFETDEDFVEMKVKSASWNF